MVIMLIILKWVVFMSLYIYIYICTIPWNTHVYMYNNIYAYKKLFTIIHILRMVGQRRVLSWWISANSWTLRMWLGCCIIGHHGSESIASVEIYFLYSPAVIWNALKESECHIGTEPKLIRVRRGGSVYIYIYINSL